MLLLAGCGDDDDDADASGDAADTEQVDAGDGGSDTGDDDASTGGGGGEPADLGDFPIPAPSDATEVTRTEAEGTVAVTLSVPVDSFDEVVAFYEDWTAESGSFQRIDAEGGGVSWVGVASGDAPRSIVLSAPLEGEAETFLSLTAAPS